jgi:hypothetical protein
MGLFDFINKAQETVENMQKKAEEWQPNQFINGSGTFSGATYTPPANDSAAAFEEYTCPICGNHEESGKKNTVHGEICADCVQRLKNRGLSHRAAKKFTREQFFALCDNSINALERVMPFVVLNSPVALRRDEHCYYVGNAYGGKIKTVTTGYTGASKGYSVRIMKNLTYRSGGSAGRAVREQVLETSQLGTFVITNQRFILMTTTYGFEIPASKVGNIQLRADGITLYAGNKTHIVMTKDTDQIAFIVTLLSEATEEYERQKELEESVSKTKRTRKTAANAPISAADEIRKYKQLADEGIITAEEFEKKKKELLGL